MKKLLLIICILMLMSCSMKNHNKVELKNMTNEDKLLEYQFVWDLLENNFIYLEYVSVPKIESIKKMYLEKIKESKTIDEYYIVMQEMLDEFDFFGHIELVSVDDYFNKLKIIKMHMEDSTYSFLEYAYSALFSDEVNTRYQMLKEELSTTHEERAHSNDDIRSQFGIIADNEKSMLKIRYPHFGEEAEEYNKKIEKYLIEHQYKYIVIDIRGNGGGNSKYADELISFFLLEDLEMDQYFIAKGDYFNSKLTEYSEDLGYDIVKTGDTYNLYKTKTIYKSKKLYNFNPNLYVITDEDVASTADYFARKTQEILNASIVGTQTSGSGSGAGDPVHIELPYSHLVVNMSSNVFADANGNKVTNPYVIPDYLEIGNPITKAYELIENKK